MTINGPTLEELNCLMAILARAKHRGVADSMLKGFLWAVWPEWYDEYRQAILTGKGYVEVQP